MSTEQYTQFKSGNLVSINGRLIGPHEPPYVIAELSGNHNGHLDRALRLIEQAKIAGADAVKLQTYTADTITIDHDGPGFVIEEGLWKGRRLYDLYREACTPWEWHEALFQKGRESDITVFSSPFDPSAVDFLEELGAPAYKIASFEIVDLPLIEKAAGTGKPLIISTGMANLREICDAVDTAKKAGCDEILVLYCVSGYPTPVSEANLRTILSMQKELNVLVGISDHTPSSIVPTAAVTLGAVAVEKHFTLRREDGGPDAAFSLEPDELADLVKNSHLAWQALGDVMYGGKESERPQRSLRRSLYVVQDIRGGELFTEKNVRSIRPGFGLPPRYLYEIIGKPASRAISRGTALTWDMVSGRKPVK